MNENEFGISNRTRWERAYGLVHNFNRDTDALGNKSEAVHILRDCEDKHVSLLAYLIIVMEDVAGMLQENLAILRGLNPNQVPAPKAPAGGAHFCSNCGAELPPAAAFCLKCGSPQQK